MAIDASIYNALSQPRKSAFDYANQFEDQAYQREQRGTQRQMNALSLQQAQQGAADDAALRNYLSGGADLTTPEGQAGLYKAAPKAAGGVIKSQLEASDLKAKTRAHEASAKSSEASAAKTQFETEQARRQQHLQELVGVQDVPGAMAWLDAAQASGELPPDRVAMAKQQLQANPQSLGQWKQGAIAGGFTLQQQREQEWKAREFSLKLDQFGEDKRRNMATEGLTARGQNLNDARGRDANTLKAAEIASGGKPPPGYRWKGDGTLEAIPGGPGDKLPEAQQKQVVGTQNLSNAIAEYRRSLAGFGKLDALSPNARAEMGTKYNNMLLQAKEAFNLGVLNGPDYDILQSVVTDPRSLTGVITSKASLDKQAAELDRIMGGIGAVSGNRRPQDGAPKLEQPAPKSIKTDSDYNSLPSGAVFVGPDGKTRRKP